MLLTADYYMTILRIKICLCWTRIVGVIWKCSRGPVFWDTVGDFTFWLNFRWANSL